MVCVSMHADISALPMVYWLVRNLRASFFPSMFFINPVIACRVYHVYSGIPINMGIVIARKVYLSFQIPIGAELFIFSSHSIHPLTHPLTNLCFLFHKGGMWPRICIKHRIETKVIWPCKISSFLSLSLFLGWGRRNKGSISAQPFYLL